MSEEGFAQPTAEHKKLHENVGTWNVTCQYFWNPAEGPMETQGTETVEMLGEFWNVTRFETTIEGRPLIGRATIGYHPDEKTWVSTWIDSFNPRLYHFTGRYDEDGKVLTMHAKAPHPATGQMVDWRTTDEMLGPDEKRFEMFIGGPEGGEFKLASYHYQRAK